MQENFSFPDLFTSHPPIVTSHVSLNLCFSFLAWFRFLEVAPKYQLYRRLKFRKRGHHKLCCKIASIGAARLGLQLGLIQGKRLFSTMVSYTKVPNREKFCSYFAWRTRSWSSIRWSCQIISFCSCCVLAFASSCFLSLLISFAIFLFEFSMDTVPSSWLKVTLEEFERQSQQLELVGWLEWWEQATSCLLLMDRAEVVARAVGALEEEFGCGVTVIALSWGISRGMDHGGCCRETLEVGDPVTFFLSLVFLAVLVYPWSWPSLWCLQRSSPHLIFLTFVGTCSYFGNHTFSPQAAGIVTAGRSKNSRDSRLNREGSQVCIQLPRPLTFGHCAFFCHHVHIVLNTKTSIVNTVLLP